MKKDEIIKQNLLSAPLSPKALKFARGVYNTYISHDEELSLEIKMSTIFKLLDLHPCVDSINDVRDILEELNEPLAVRNFEFNGEKIQLKFVQFCCYKIEKESVKLELSPEYIYVQRYYMLDSFLF